MPDHSRHPRAHPKSGVPALTAALVLCSASAAAEPRLALTEHQAPAPSARVAAAEHVIEPAAVPELPPTELDFLQYGAAFAFEGRAKSGSVCPAGSTAPCILGSGGGLGLRVGHRSHEGWYIGGAYEFSKQDASSLLRLPILQQLRAEARKYLLLGTRMSPYIAGAAGLVGYGSEWKIDTFGPMVGAQIGLEFESTREVYVGFAPAYRVMRLRGWTDGAGQERPGAFAHFLGLELTLEARSAFARW
jgi:hypothetical protein